MSNVIPVDFSKGKRIPAADPVVPEPAPEPFPSALAVGHTVEAGSLRIHRFMDSITVHDLTNAGKRGKKVAHFSFGYFAPDAETVRLTEALLRYLVRGPSYADALKATRMALDGLVSAGKKCVSVNEHLSRGVDVLPASAKKIEISNDHVKIETTEHEFAIRDLHDKDNEPTTISTNRSGAKAFYAFARDNTALLQTTTYHDLLTILNHRGIGHHSYCAMD